MLLGEHFFEVGVEDFGVEMEFVGVAAEERFVGVHYSDEGEVFIFGEGAEEAFHVAVDESYDGDVDGWGGGGGGEGVGEDNKNVRS
jgi:hypothetical protein